MTKRLISFELARTQLQKQMPMHTICAQRNCQQYIMNAFFLSRPLYTLYEMYVGEHNILSVLLNEN